LKSPAGPVDHPLSGWREAGLAIDKTRKFRKRMKSFNPMATDENGPAPAAGQTR
jgi:hypothetical protein